MADAIVLTPEELEDEAESEVLTTIDSFWLVEKATLAALAGAQGQRIIRGKIDQTMPSALQPVTLAECSLALKQVKPGTVMKWCGEAANREIDIVVKALTDIREMHPNPAKLLTSDYLKKVSQTFAWFARLEVVQKDKEK